MTFDFRPDECSLVYPRRRFTLPLPGGRTLELGERTLVMGIINVTPDSFSDGGRAARSRARAIEAGVRMVEDGADLLDVGGESTRPGAAAARRGEERRRVLPVIEGLAGAGQRADLRRHLQGLDRRRGARGGRVDRQRHQRAALRAGAGRVVAQQRRADHPDAHARALAATCTSRRSTTTSSTRCSTSCARASRLPPAPASRRTRMLVDPGLGFAKEPPHSYEVLARLDEFSELGRPLVVGPSRKAFPDARRLRTAMSASERDWPTAAAVTAAVLAGAHIVRVHAVREMVQVVRVADEIRKYHRERLMEWLAQLAAAAASRRRRGGTLLDIALVSVLIYELLLLIRGTRAVQMALSGGFLIGLFFLSRVARARDGQLGDSQPRRLRRVRDHRALPGRHPPRARALRPRPVLPVLRARDERRRDASRSWWWRRPRWRRDASARSSSSSGRSACATTSRAAFRSTPRSPTTCSRRIFQPGSPLHDGAVIVQGDRIAAAACFLPLSVNPRVSRELGTRHRAALGPHRRERRGGDRGVRGDGRDLRWRWPVALERGLTPRASARSAARAAQRRRSGCVEPSRRRSSVA